MGKNHLYTVFRAILESSLKMGATENTGAHRLYRELAWAVNCPGKDTGRFFDCGLAPFAQDDIFAGAQNNPLRKRGGGRSVLRPFYATTKYF